MLCPHVHRLPFCWNRFSEKSFFFQLSCSRHFGQHKSRIFLYSLVLSALDSICHHFRSFSLSPRLILNWFTSYRIRFLLAFGILSWTFTNTSTLGGTFCILRHARWVILYDSSTSELGRSSFSSSGNRWYLLDPLAMTLFVFLLFLLPLLPSPFPHNPLSYSFSSVFAFVCMHPLVCLVFVFILNPCSGLQVHSCVTHHYLLWSLTPCARP